ncbi:MAG: zinc metalloprotease HtpX [Fusobacteriaceae bacterium]|jgi:heat shock protein HtpX|nr:zinc metalloprotease HtpX [Fusobacteriaceae bacterium]
MNGIKTFVLMVVMSLLLMFVGSLIGGRSGMFVALLISFAMNFVSYWFSDKMVLARYHAQPLPESDKYYRMVEELARRADLPTPKVYMINQAQPNAFATGRNPEHAAVVLTTGIMQTMNDQELSGVIGHELGHVKHRDILLQTVAATMASAITFLSRMAPYGAMGGGDRRRRNNGLILLLVMILAPIGAMLVQLAISRSREYKADEFGAEVCGNPNYLADALEDLDSSIKRIPMANVNPATENMFIMNPLSGGGIASLFSTHPPIQERIRRLRAMAR